MAWHFLFSAGEILHEAPVNAPGGAASGPARVGAARDGPPPWKWLYAATHPTFGSTTLNINRE